MAVQLKLFVLLVAVFALVIVACGTDTSRSQEQATSVTDTPQPTETSTSQPTETAASQPTETPTSEPAAPPTSVGAESSPTSDATEAPVRREDTTEVPRAQPQEATATPLPPPKVASGPKAAEIQGIVAWINSDPLTLRELRGKVVLIDFWTYTCVNCIRTFPYLKVWYSKYADDGLVIIGVHAPEFEFEKKLENVQEAVKRFNIGWAVALDNDFMTWRAYDNMFWPAKYLIDKDGIVRYTHFGEGAYAETENMIQELLMETGTDPSSLPLSRASDQKLDPSYQASVSSQITRELYGGWGRGYRDAQVGRGGYLAQIEYYEERDRDFSYEDSGDHVDHLIYLQGQWHNGPESLRHARETTDFEDYLFLRFSAKSVNAVLRPEGEGAGPLKVLVTLDGKPLTEENKGQDVVIEEDGRSFLYVDEPTLYAIVEAPSYGTYDLKLSSNSPHFALFAFTFGVYESGV